MPSATPLTAPTRPRLGLLLALVVVLAVHLGLLGGLPPPLADTPTAAPLVSLHTRTLPPPVAAIPVTTPPAPRERPTPPVAPKTPGVAAAEHTENSDGFMPLPPVDTAQSATESIANSVPAPVMEAPAPAQAPPMRYVAPAPVRLNYDVVAVIGAARHVAGAEIIWQHDDANYQASLRVTKVFILMRQWTSRGALAPDGLAPLRFGDKGFRRSEEAAHFVREDRKVLFSANTPEVPLLSGAQDHLSVFVQLAGLWAGAPGRFAAGDSISFQSIGARHAETWTFVVSPEESITVPGGTLSAIKLTREPTSEYGTRAELWLAPQLAYLPAHIRLTEGRDNVLDMVWTDSQTP